MATNLIQTSKKLMTALNAAGYKLTYTSKQFMGREGRVHTMHSVNQASWREDKGKYFHTELYATTSMVRIVMFLRDLWYTHLGWELPTDQPLWNDVRKGLEDKKRG